MTSQRVIFSKNFKKQLAKQPRKVQLQFDIRYELWCLDPNDPVLNVHRLKGRLSRFYSLNVTGDVRALYEVIDNTVYVYQLIGSHSQLYD